jgi:hypothetical protein
VQVPQSQLPVTMLQAVQTSIQVIMAWQQPTDNK